MRPLAEAGVHFYVCLVEAMASLNLRKGQEGKDGGLTAPFSQITAKYFKRSARGCEGLCSSPSLSSSCLRSAAASPSLPLGPGSPAPAPYLPLQPSVSTGGEQSVGMPVWPGIWTLRRILEGWWGGVWEGIAPAWRSRCLLMRFPWWGPLPAPRTAASAGR